MKTSPSSRRGRASREADRLVDLAEGLAQSGSRAEDRFWENRLDAEIDGLITNGDEGSLNAALDRLADRESRAYEELADAIEGRVEHTVVKSSDGVRDVLLIAAPVLAWSRMPVPTRALGAAMVQSFRKMLIENVFSENTDLAIADYFFSPDQLPETFGETAELRLALTAQLSDGRLPVDTGSLNETAQFLADQRYLIGVVSAPVGSPLFRWQDGLVSRDEVMAAWRQASQAAFGQLLPACGFEPMLPRAYYVACRDADRAARPFSITASVAFLSTTLGISPSHLSAVVAGCYNRTLEEYRVGFQVAEQDDVIHGVVWPLLGAEDEMSDVVEEIEAVLREAGIQQIEILRQRMPMEYCEDCGAPMYPNTEGEMVHAELPETSESAGQHLH
ncbi:MAG: DUF2863 family protein [Betaproteobacteria bacterium]|nr:DUF2863 family protein [Betaproteobacteria bacterium]